MKLLVYIDPDGSEIRRQHKLKRRTYYVKVLKIHVLLRSYYEYCHTSLYCRVPTIYGTWTGTIS